MKQLRIGIIGCGRISVMHFEAAVDLEEAILVACADVKPERAEEKAEKYGIVAYTDYKKMIAREDLDVVQICLPHYLHSEVAIYAMEQGLDVITEKPMDVDVASAERAIAVSRATGRKFGVISQCRYNDSAQLVKKAVQSGKLGRILSARSTLTWSRSDDYYSHSDWKGTWDKEGGGVVIDQAIHSIDLVRFIVDDEVESVSCNMANRRHKIVDVEDSAEGFITFKNGTTYGFWCMNNYSCDEPIEIRLNCERGKVVFGYNEAKIQYKDGTVEEVKKAPQTFKGKDYWGNWHVRQLSNFYRACLDLEPLEIDGEEALKTHKLICRIYDEGGMRPKA
ncbi:MAG: Gfo/Idh/MocA family oxidoreductase [Clostridia bacterium]|nr:Gfo/Idh/MocA family oxidoreductase [Clostridia bacterium]